MTKLINSNCIKNSKFYETKLVMKFENSNCDETQTQMVIKLKNSNCDKTETQIVTKLNKGSPLKKTIESVSMLIPRGGDLRASAHTSLGFLCMLQTHLFGSRKSPKKLCSLLTQYFMCFLIYVTSNINPLTFNK